MKILRTTCKPLLLCLLCASGFVAAQTSAAPADLVWQNVTAIYSAPRLQPASLTDAQLASIRSLLIARQKRTGMWECEDQSWLTGLTYSRMPIASHLVLLVEAGAGCARGGQGANGAMWLIDWIGAKPRLIAAPDEEFNGWLYSIQPEEHHGFHDLVLGWHMSGREAGLSYFRFDGNVYKQVSSATLVIDDDDNRKIIPPQTARR